ncbi:PP2C family protein-serine/threonine phosphatase [Streptomyces sp. NPDC051657]|uniref:PP2C family protein-serine/threonine phosphatase n=1 Tax=unclassified Streptomyces TaxID=2593676 RepID=UPI0034380BE5
MKQPRMPTTRHAAGACAGALLALAVALTDVLLGPQVTLLAVFVVAPAVAASRNTAGGVIGTGLLAGVLATALAHHYHLLGSSGGILPLLALGLVTALSAIAARTRTRHERQLTQIRDIAGTAQDAIIGSVPTSPGPARIAASYESAANTAQIGGDFYDVTPVRGGIRVVIGDVQGKGLGAVRTAASILAAFRESAPVAARLETVGLKMSCALTRHNVGDRFVTAVLAELSDDGTLSLLNYGHPAPLVLPAPGGITWAEPDRPGMPLGLDVLGHCRPGRHDRTLITGDRVLFHTDGLDEARDPAGHFYPLSTRAGLMRDDTLATGLELLRKDVQRHTTATSPMDDSALLLLEYAGHPRPLTQRQQHPAYSASGPGCEKCAVTSCPIPTELRPHGPHVWPPGQ